MKRQYHANKLRKYYVCIESITCEPVVCDFSVPVNVIGDDVLPISTCAVVYDEDQDFGYLDLVPDDLCQPEEIQLPSKQI